MCHVPLVLLTLLRPAMHSMRVQTPACCATSARLAEMQISPRALTVQIKTAPNVSELLHMHTIHTESFNSIHTAAFWHRLGKLSKTSGASRGWLTDHREALRPVRDQTLSTLQSSPPDPRAVSNIAWGLAAARLGSAFPWSPLWRQLEVSLLAVLETEPQGSVDDPPPEAGEAVSTQSLANTVWAFAAAGAVAPALFDRCAGVISRKASDFKTQELANTAWAYALASRSSSGRSRVDNVDSTMWAALSESTRGRVDEFSAQSVANLAWAFATAGERDARLFDAVAADITGRLGSFKEQELANIAWAFATAAHPAPDLFAALEAESSQRIGAFWPQGLANLAWAFATAGHPAPKLFNALAQEATARVAEFQPQGLANTAWAFATAGHPAPELFDALAAEATKRRSAFKGQELVSTLWAFATASHASNDLFEQLVREAGGRMAELKPQEISNLLWSCAAAGHYCQEVIDAMAADAATKGTASCWLGGMSARGLTNLAWALATLNYPRCEPIFRVIAERSTQASLGFSSQHLATLAWAFAVADVPSPIFGMRSHFAAISAGTAALHPLGQTHLCQVHQWVLWRQERVQTSSGKDGGGDLCGGIGGNIRAGSSADLGSSWHENWHEVSEDVAKVCMESFTSREAQPSHFQLAVGESLRELGLELEAEVCTPQGYSIDFVVELGGRRVAVEVDGPSHYLGATRMPTGATTLKRRQLRAFGWRLLSVPYWEWSALKNARNNEERSKQCRAYLRRQLEEALGEASPVGKFRR